MVQNHLVEYSGDLMLTETGDPTPSSLKENGYFYRIYGWLDWEICVRGVGGEHTVVQFRRLSSW